jgi:aspartate kinase/aspartokinase/homoserine dehydrogenase 1
VNLFGRGGSDYTAAALARCTGAASLDVWKDVDGFMTADPGIVQGASRIEKLSYNEAAELAYFGARILHPETVSPLVKAKIPLRILNIDTFSREIVPSTIINGYREVCPGVVKSITSSDDFGILRIQGAGVGARPGILAEITNRLEQEKINIKSVITSQTAINILLSKKDLARAHRSIDLSSIGAIAEITATGEISVIAAVGEGIMERAGIMARIIGAAGARHINLQTIVMGASPVSAYLVVDRRDRDAALQTIHLSQFIEKQHPTAN